MSREMRTEPMRILVISPYFPPRNATGALRVHAFAAAWATAGEQVTVLTTRKRDYQRGAEIKCDDFAVVELDYEIPHFLERMRHSLRASPANGREGADGNGRFQNLKAAARRLQFRTGIFGAGRMPDFTDRWVRPAVAWASAQPGWDVVFSSAGPYTAHLVALAIKLRRPAIRWVAEYRDLWVDNPLHRGLFPFTLRERWLERRCLRHADLLVTVSEPMAQTLRARTTAPVEVIYNGFDPAEIDRLPKQRVFPDDGVARLVFTGTIYPGGQDANVLFEAMASLRERTPDAAARLRLVVAGPTGDVWLKGARRFRVGDMVENRGVVSRSVARSMQRDADALLLVDFNPGVQGVLTGKAFEYLSVTAPILVVGGSTGSPLGTLVSCAGRGVHLACDAQQIARTLLALTGGGTVPVGPPDVDFINTLTRAHQSQRLHQHLLEPVCGRPSSRAASEESPAPLARPRSGR